MHKTHLPPSAVTAALSPHYYPPLTIMHTTCHSAWGGLERRIFNEACWMAKHGHRIIIAAPPNTPLAEKVQKKCFGPNPWQYLPIKFINKSMVKDFFMFINHYKKIRPDILNTHGNIDSKVALSAAKAFLFMEKREIPCKILSRHISAHVKPTWYNKMLYGTLCDHVFTTADYTTQHLISTLNLTPRKVLTMPSGITPMDHLPDRKIAREKLASDLGLAQDSHFIGFVGRVSPDKGVGDIIRAFLNIKEKLPHHHLVIVGDGETDYIASLIEQAEGEVTLNGTPHTETMRSPQPVKISGSMEAINPPDQCQQRIHFMGFRENVWPYLAAFDCNVLASATQFEGISQALLESMFAKCPAIASNSGGSPEIITHGQTGLLFIQNDPADLSRQLLTLLHSANLGKNLADNAFSQVKTRHTLDAMGHRTLKIYAKRLSNDLSGHPLGR